MRNFPGPPILDEDQGRRRILFDPVGARLEAVVEDKGRNPNVPEDVDLQVIGAHRQVTDCSQTVGEIAQTFWS